jgi:hypothetical protein
MPVVKPPADNITMVALHGSNDSRPDLTELVAVTTEKIRSVVAELGLPDGFFRAYEDYQIHATIIGMEVVKIGDELFNANFLNNNGVLRTIHPRGLLALLEDIGTSRDHSPLFTLRFGGFRKSYCKCRGVDLLDWACISSDSEFHSFERSAYEGSFYAFRGGPVVLTGWPIIGPNQA